VIGDRRGFSQYHINLPATTVEIKFMWFLVY